MLSRLKSKFEVLVKGPVAVLARLGFTPNHLTLIGLIMSLLCFYLFFQRHAVLAGFVLLVCGLFDAMDGALARYTGLSTTFGALFDSVSDRYSDFFVIAGMILGGLVNMGWGLLAILGSFMVSYVRARGEAAGAGKLDIGIAERGERVLILAFFSILNLPELGVILVAILANLTAIHRFVVAALRLT